ncbi:probable ATP-dependent RNA helicase DDX46 isoform X1 [Lingula anatina]|uniref:Probable ATP-dependent RNA helicase DDX46 n=1 Tax=Lingula anatina TaxID=7574 RepID=A0A1S3JXV8_LINAN|nr:probable ATP-dependent RNA helicase DDX46 isoform X1 [Lingula anatina]|eukprot:XP_013414889.1 probable ATP-dependent RNA helicase DDX46 isoform X1 [Lingula anatina]
MPREGRSYRKRSRSRSTSRSPDRSKKRKSRSRSPKSRTRRSRSRERVRRSRSRDRDRSRRSRSRERTQRSRRSRSRDRERDRDRDRDRDKNRDREKDKDRDRKPPEPSLLTKNRRSTSRERNKKSRSKTPEKVIEGAIKVKDEPMDKEAEQKRLEDEMQKRRERIEKWREDRKKTIVLPQINIAPPSKTWSLEDDADDEEEEVKQENGADDEDEIDPLDAYMQQVNDEVKHVKSNLTGAGNQAGTKGASVSEPVSKVTFVTAVAKSKDDPAKKKGELMESNIDAMEYSSEEEEEGVEEMFAGMQKKKKEFLAIDHSKIYYGPFKKDFYVEVPELTKMSQEEVDQLRDELEGIKVRGKGCPKPIRNWAQCGVSKKIMECLKRYDYEKPTPIQAQAIPAIMSGRDVIGIAKTGSGKTLAFLLPMLRHVLDQPPLEEGDGSIAIILTPTRELAMQITKECKKFTKNLGLQAVCVYGGTGISEQIAELKRGAEIIVCTPGRMIDMLAANNGRVTNCRRCTFVVLDEADRMFDMGFEPQVMRIVDNIRPDRQTVMFSATFPRQMEALARKILTKPIEVQVGGRSVVCKDVEQHVVVIDDDSKFFKLLELLGVYQEQGSVLVFVDKQEHADELMKNLMKHSYPCMSLHGGIDQYDRDSTITDFKQGNVKLLVATSVAARGLDVKHLILVVNYDCPNHYEDYVHRCGRTGRAGNKGFAYTFITPEQERYANDIIKALEQSGAVVPADLQKLWDDYKARAEAEGKKIKSSSGFRGKGFKFDETEAHLADERKKLQKAALGLQDSDEEDAGIDIDQQIEDMFASKTRVTDVHQPMINQQAQPTASNQQKLELAKRLASMINRQKNLGAEAQDITQQAAASILQGLPSQAPQVSAKTIAEQMAEKINAKIGYRPPAEEEKEGQEQQGETFKRYELELEINDFPQTARWKVTSKEALAQICEYSEAGITVRGTYFPPGKLPKEEERKLYLAIEATSELSIQKAKTEITRLIKEELVRLQNSYQPINRGRYKVL